MIFDTRWYLSDTGRYAAGHVARQTASQPPHPRRGSRPDPGCGGEGVRGRGLRRGHHRRDRSGRGVHQGAVYSNFESKDELFLALLDREFELRGQQIAIALDRSAGDTTAAAREVSRSVLDSVRDHSDYYVLLVEYWLRAQRDPQLRERLIERRAAADQALHIVESTDTVPGDRRLTDIAQLVVTLNLGVAMEEVLRPGTINPDLLAQLITALLESIPV